MKPKGNVRGIYRQKHQHERNLQGMSKVISIFVISGPESAYPSSCKGTSCQALFYLKQSRTVDSIHAVCRFLHSVFSIVILLSQRILRPSGTEADQRPCTVVFLFTLLTARKKSRGSGRHFDSPRTMEAATREEDLD